MEMGSSMAMMTEEMRQTRRILVKDMFRLRVEVASVNKFVESKNRTSQRAGGQSDGRFGGRAGGRGEEESQIGWRIFFRQSGEKPLCMPFTFVN